MDLKTFNDPIHGHIKLPNYIVQIIDTPEFQRLRYLKQTGFADHVFSGAIHTRFNHCIGVSYLSRKLVNNIRKRQPELQITDKEVKCVTIAGLLHDLGHGPFSHTFEKWAHTQGMNFHHEEMSMKLLEHLFKSNNISIPNEDIEFVKQLIDGTIISKYAERGFLFEIVANKRNSIDVDKFDYLVRDAYHAGITERYDFKRLINSARVINNEICYPHKDFWHINSLYNCRYTLFKKVYTHPVAHAIELMVCDALTISSSKLKISERIDDINKYITLTDNILHEIRISKSKDLRPAREIIRRIEKRDLYKLALEINIPMNSNKTPTPSDILSVQTDNKLTEDDIVIDTFMNNYAMKDKNPIDNVHFYSKRNLDKSFNIDSKIESALMPREFAEKRIRIYVKDVKKLNILTNILNKYFDYKYSSR